MVTRTRHRSIHVDAHRSVDRSAYLLVILNESSSVFSLPHSGSVVIGRGPESDLLLNHASVSRRHATIRIDDGVLRIADLGSHNGTRVNGEPVDAARELASGDVASVGDVVLVVHFSQAVVPSRVALTETEWRRRLAEELERALTFQRSLAVIAVIAPKLPVATLTPALRMIDVIGETEDGQQLLLLPEVDHDQAVDIAARIHTIAPNTRLGLAMCPTDAVDADTILLAARTAARRGTPGQTAEPGDNATEVELCSDVGARRVLIADPAMHRVFELLERLAPSELPVVITGESGTGKETAAYTLHYGSQRTGPFIAVSCAALDDHLIEGELFGQAACPGVLENAAHGTVFLDDVDALPIAIQTKLFAAFQSKQIMRVGETRERPIDVRVIVATRRQLEIEVVAGRFRYELYSWLGSASVVIPPLRDRRCEIPLLARALLAEACTRANRKPMTIDPAAMQVLLMHRWSGNVRELQYVMEQIAIMAPDEHVEQSDLPEYLDLRAAG